MVRLRSIWHPTIRVKNISYYDQGMMESRFTKLIDLIIIILFKLLSENDFGLFVVCITIMMVLL